MTKSELYQKGDAMRRSMYGEEAYNKANETVYGCLLYTSDAADE